MQNITGDDLITFSSNLDDLQKQISYYSCLTIGSIGLISNLINMAVCMRKKIGKEAMGFYNPLMSLFNILSLISGILQLFPTSIGQNDLIVASNYHCILMSYLTRVSIHMSSWLNIMLSLDRTISITHPNRFTWHKDRGMLVKIVFGILMVILVINVPNLMFGVIVVETTTSENVTLITKLCSCKYVYLVVISDFVKFNGLFLALEFQNFAYIQIQIYVRDNSDRYFKF